MKNVLLSTVACGLGLGISSIGLADHGRQPSGQYVSPSRWNSFNVSAAQAEPNPVDAATPLNDFGSSLLSGDVNLLPLPQEIAAEASAYLPSTPIWDVTSVYGSGVAEDQPVVHYEPPCTTLLPWFGGADLLFWSLANSTDQRLVLDSAAPGNTLLSSRRVDPGSGLGYDILLGRYLENGQRAISLNYLHFDPGSRDAFATAPAAGDWFAAMPAWDNIGYYDDPTNVGSEFSDLGGIFASMGDFRVRRDVRFQGIELSLWSFGLGGGRRISPPPGSGLSGGWTQRALGALPGYRAYGFGGFGGALEVPTVGSNQFAVSQGFRWLQIQDDFLFAASGHEPPAGEPLRAEQSYTSQARNDLFGYQLGGRWNHRATARFNIGAGMKAGIYANSVDVDRRIGEAAMPAQYRNDLSPAGRFDVNERSQRTVLATVGEFDVGGGYRLSNAWTIRGGYRVTGFSGVATTPSLLARELYSPNLSARDAANDNLILHGAYLGSEFNW